MGLLRVSAGIVRQLISDLEDQVGFLEMHGNSSRCSKGAVRGSSSDGSWSYSFSPTEALVFKKDSISTIGQISWTILHADLKVTTKEILHLFTAGLAEATWPVVKDSYNGCLFRESTRNLGKINRIT